MISATRRWLRRNRKGLAVGAGVVGVGYLAGQYVLGKISEARERMSSERIAKENLRRRFEQNQTDCTFTVLALLPTASENILAALPVEELTNQLQQKKAERLAKLSAGEVTASEISSGPPSTIDDNGKGLENFKSQGYIHASQHLAESTLSDKSTTTKSRTQLWNELKINSLTRSFTLLYTLSLLSLLTRIQLNLLGRRNYLSSVVSLASPQQELSTISLEDHDDNNPENAFGNDFETNRRYLTFSWWLLHRGWRDLMERVEEAVNDVFGPLNPREDLTQERLSNLVLEVRKKVEGQTAEERLVKRWLPYMLPPQEQEDYVLQESGVLSSEPVAPQTVSNLRHLLDETSDLIDSPSFTHVLSLLNNEAFSHLIDNKCAAEAFKHSPPPRDADLPDNQPNSSSATITPASEASRPKAKLATILAVVSRQAHSIGQGTNPPNEYLAAMEEGVKELEAFAAVVYSSNFGHEAPRGAAADSPADGGLGGSSYIAVSPQPSPRAKPAHEGIGVESSIVDLGELSTTEQGDGHKAGFEAAWGKAVDHP